MSSTPNFHYSYTYADGDFVLLSSDDVRFRVHSFMLKSASGFFRQMLEIPRLTTELAKDPVLLTESSQTISLLLDLIYPAGAALPAIPDFEVAWSITLAADKYDMPRVMDTIRMIVSSNDCFHHDALALYPLAHRWKWADIVKSASSDTLALNILANVPALRKLESADLCDLLQYRVDKKGAILRNLELHSLYGPVWTSSYNCNCDMGTSVVGFERLMKIVEMYVTASLDAIPLGTELRSHDFWESLPLDMLWDFKCRDCKKPLVIISKFVLKIRDVLDSTLLVSDITMDH